MQRRLPWVPNDHTHGPLPPPTSDPREPAYGGGRGPHCLLHPLRRFTWRARLPCLPPYARARHSCSAPVCTAARVGGGRGGDVRNRELGCTSGNAAIDRPALRYGNLNTFAEGMQYLLKGRELRSMARIQNSTCFLLIDSQNPCQITLGEAFFSNA